MQDFWVKTMENDRQSAILYFVSAEFVMGYPCARPYILFYMHGPAIFHFLSYVNITNYLNSKWPLKMTILESLASKS